MDKSTGDLSQAGGSFPSHLMMTSVDYVDDKYCSIAVKQREDKFCAGIMEGGKDSCTGDSGGIIFKKTRQKALYKQLPCGRQQKRKTVCFANLFALLFHLFNLRLTFII